MQILDRAMPPPESNLISSKLRLRYPGVLTLVLIWAFIGASTSLRNFLSSPGEMRTSFIFWIAYIACYLPWGFLTAIAFRLEGRFQLGAGNTPRNLMKLALASIPMSLIAAPLMRGAFEGTLSLLGHPVVRTRTWSHWFYELFIGEFFYWLSIAGAYSLRTLLQLQRQKETAMQLTLEKSRLEASLRRTQLEVLRAKLNPHFLFNSLQNISVLTRQDPLTASRMLSKLGDLLRAVLRTDSQAETSLHEEIALTRHCMALDWPARTANEVGPGPEFHPGTAWEDVSRKSHLQHWQPGDRRYGSPYRDSFPAGR